MTVEMQDAEKAKRRYLGSLGGKATLERHGREHFSAIGKIGGEKIAANGSHYMASLSELGLAKRRGL